MGNSSSKQKATGKRPEKAPKAAKAKSTHKAKGPGHTLGGGKPNESTGGGGGPANASTTSESLSTSSGKINNNNTGSPSPSTPDARSAAASAAAARLEKKNTGELGAKLDKDRAKSRTQQLADVSKQNLNTRNNNDELVFD